jgi:hypothetical protein
MNASSTTHSNVHMECATTIVAAMSVAIGVILLGSEIMDGDGGQASHNPRDDTHCILASAEAGAVTAATP